MKVLSAFVEKTSFYPLNHLSSGDSGHLFFQTRGDGLYPLIKDGDILRIEQAAPSDLHSWDLTLLERPNGQFAVHFVLLKKNRMNGHKGPVKPERLVGLVASIEREGGTKRCNDRLARFAHITYFVVRPLILFFLVTRKILSLFQPKFFVKDAESSLRCVTEKFNEEDEVAYHAQRAFDGLDAHEQHLVAQFMRRRGRVLNIGCGAGREAFALAGLGFEVVGVDVAPRMIEAARSHALSNGKNIRFEVKGATDLEYSLKSFDYVFMAEGVYSLIPTRDLRIDVLRKIEELLTPDGTLFFSALYRRDSVLSRVFLYSAFRRFAKPLLKERLHSEPGDILVRHVSPVGTTSKLCYLHLFKDAGEVLEEVSSAGLEGFEDKQSGYWIVRHLKEGNSQGTFHRELER